MNEKYNIIIDNGINRIIAEGPIQTTIDNSEYGGYEHFLFNMRIENKEGKILSTVLNKVPFSSMCRTGADLDEQYTMEGFYLTKDSFGYLRSESWTSVTNTECEFTYNNIEGENMEVLNKYLDVIISFEKQGTLPSQSKNKISWDNLQRVLLISQSE